MADVWNTLEDMDERKRVNIRMFIKCNWMDIFHDMYI